MDDYDRGGHTKYCMMVHIIFVTKYSVLFYGQMDSLPVETIEKYRDHELISSKNYKNVRECHIKPDWLLIYRVECENLILKLLRTGSHSDLF